MKKIITFILILFCVNVFAQKTYTFDYFTIYEYKTSEQDSISSKAFTIANSKDSSYFILISAYKNNTASVILYDFKSNEQYRFNSNVTINENTDFGDLFSNPVPFIYDLKKYKEKAVDKYDVIHQNDTIIVRKYRNKRKKKIILDYFFIMEENQIAKNQFYTSNLAFSYTFDISKVKTDKIIKESFVIEYDDKAKNNKKNIRTLKDIQPIDFILNIPTDINTTN